MAKTPQQAVDKWKRGMQNGVTSYKEGIQSVTESPMEKAIANEQGMLNGVTQAVQSGKWRAGLRRTTLQQWKDSAMNAGAQKFAMGAAKGEQKMQRFMAEFMPFVQGVKQQVQAMPASTEEERFQRMVANYQKMKQFKRSGS